LMKIRHPNIVLFMGASVKPENTFLLMELAEKGNLHDVIVNENPSWLRRLYFARDVMRGLNYLHLYKPNPIVHRDLKSQNILILSNYTAKICDFGLAKVETKALEREMSLLGTTLRWMPPEMLREPPDYTLESDMYVLGLIMWEIITGEYPFDKINTMDFLRGLQNEINPVRPQIKNESEWLALGEGRAEYVEVMRQCWEFLPAKRLKCEDALVKVEKIVEELETSVEQDKEKEKEKEKEKQRVRSSTEGALTNSGGGLQPLSGTSTPRLTRSPKGKTKEDEKPSPDFKEKLSGTQGRAGAAINLNSSNSSPKHHHHNMLPSMPSLHINWRHKFSGAVSPDNLFKHKKN